MAFAEAKREQLTLDLYPGLAVRGSHTVKVVLITVAQTVTLLSARAVVARLHLLQLQLQLQRRLKLQL
jgi:hypothetical protein